MESEKIEILKNCCKDEKSFERVRSLLKEVIDERDDKKRRMCLLESAIKKDYNSILITELSLEEPGPRIVYANDGFCEMTGYSREELIGKTPRILQGPKTEQAVLDRLKKSLKEGQSFYGQTVNYRKDGSEFVNQWDIHPLTDRDGNITHWVSYQKDISERKRMEQHIVDQKVEFDELREELQRIFVDMDGQGNILMANQSFCKLSGYSSEELEGTKVWELFPDKTCERVKKRFENEIDDFDQDSFKDVLRRKDDSCVQIKGETMVLDLKGESIIRAKIDNISMQKKVASTLVNTCIENDRTLNMD